jgi:hypothetical protein
LSAPEISERCLALIINEMQIRVGAEISPIKSDSILL